MSRVLYVEATAEPEDDVRVVGALERLALDLGARPGWLGARLLRNTADRRVLLLETSWGGLEPSLEGLMPDLGAVKLRSWAFDVLA